jgi:Neutral/alkaline non-lysosomal ceramidase, N-terminal
MKVNEVNYHFSHSLLLLIAFGLAALNPADAADSVPSPYRVGLAKVDITPLYSIRLSGFSFRQKESEGVRDPIYARAMAIKRNDRTVVLVAVDSIGIPMSLRRDVAARLKAERGIASEDLAICATHSHSTPALKGMLPTMFAAPVPAEHQQRIDRYTQELSKHLVEVATAALDDLQPSDLSFVIGKVSFAINRRTRGGPVDHDLPLLAIRCAKGQVRGIWVNYACHCVVLSDFQVSGDWAGCASAALEKKYPDSVGLVTIGCGADANPEARGTGGIAQQFGNQILAEVDRLLQSNMKTVHGDIRTTMDSIGLPLAAIPSKEDWKKQAKTEGAGGYYAQYQLDRLKRGEKLPAEVEYPIQTWKFGDSLAAVFLPGEVVVDYSLRLKKEFDSARLCINAYSNDVPAYIPSERILKEGGYEAGGAMHFYGWPAWFAPGLEDKIVASVGKQLGETFKRQADRVGTLGITPKSPKETVGNRPSARRTSSRDPRLAE